MGLAWLLNFPFYVLCTRGAKGWFWIAGSLSLAFLGFILYAAG
jgi:hypothetical protein